MTLIDVDGWLEPEALAVRGATEAARAIRRLDIGGSIGIDLPTTDGKAARQDAAEAIDAVLPKPFERTAVNGFGFVQVVRRRARASLIELARDRASFEARALIASRGVRTAWTQATGSPSRVIVAIGRNPAWLDAPRRAVGGAVSLRADAALPMSGGYAENL